MEFSIRLDYQNSVFVRWDKESPDYHETPTAIAATPEGVAVGRETEGYYTQSILDKRLFVDSDRTQSRIPPENHPIAAFLSSVIRNRWPSDWETIQNNKKSDTQENEIQEINDDSEVSAVISVPGAFTYSARNLIEQAASAVGITSCTVVPRPDPVAVRLHKASTSSNNDIPTLNKCLIIDINDTSVSLGIYDEEEDSKVRTIRRKDQMELGSQTWSRQVAEKVLTLAGENRDATVEYSTKTLQSVADSVRESLRADTNIGPPTVEMQLTDGVALKAGDHTLSDSIKINTELTSGLIYSALQEYTADLTTSIESLVEDADLEFSDLSFVGINGEGAKIEAIYQSILDLTENDLPVVFGRDYQNYGNLGTPPEPIETDVPTKGTIDGIPRITVMSEQGLSTIQLSSGKPENGEEFEVALHSPAPDIQHGQLKIEVFDPYLETVIEDRMFTISGLPGFGVAKPDPINFNVAISRDVSTGFTFELNPKSAPGSVTIEQREINGGVWMLSEDTDPDSLPQDIQGTDHDSETIYARAVGSDPLSTEITPEDTIDAIDKIRTNLWRWGVVEQNNLSPNNIEIILRDLDQMLSKQGIQFFVPETGTEAGRRHHFVRETRDSDEPEGTIIEVFEPGIEIDGKVSKKAIVAIAGD
jgi:molecular chaperone GrpE